MSSPASDLFSAIDADDREAAVTALSDGTPIDTLGPLGLTACYLAAAYGSTNGERVRILYEQGLCQTIGGHSLSTLVKAHIRCYLPAAGSQSSHDAVAGPG